MADQSQPHSPQPVPGTPEPAYVPTQHAGEQPAAAYNPPPGYVPPPGYGPPPGFAPQAETASAKVGTAMLCSIVSIAAIALAVSIEEDGRNGWEDIGVWAGFAIAAAVATIVPSIRSSVGLDLARAWRIGLSGAIGLASFWVLFVLPSINQNVSFLATVGVVAGGAAVWMAPGRPDAPAPDPGQTW